MSEEHKAAIGRGQERRHREAREARDPSLEPTSKKCTKCGIRKPLGDFTMRKYKTKSGEVTRHPAPECRECAAKRRAKWREDYIAEHGEEAYRQLQNRYNKNRDPEKRRRYQREYGRMERMEQGVASRGPWKKYRREVGASTGSDRVPVEPFVAWIDATPEVREVLTHNANLARAVNRVRGQERVSIGLVDQLGTSLGDPDLVNRLYPLE